MTFSEKLQALFHSRRFYAALASLLAITVGNLFGVDETTINTVVMTFVAWIVGDSIKTTGGFKVFQASLLETTAELQPTAELQKPAELPETRVD